MLGHDTLSGHGLDQLPDLGHDIVGLFARADQRSARQLGAVLDEVAELDLDADGLDDLAHVLAHLFAYLDLLRDDDGLAEGLEHELGGANLLPDPQVTLLDSDLLPMRKQSKNFMTAATSVQIRFQMKL